jgi:hypothetical protein
MRLNSRRVFAAVGTMVAAAAVMAAMPLASRAVVQVTVNARCAGQNNTEITVSPWNVRLAQGDEVVVIRKPWPVGQWGKVISFTEFNPCYFRVEVALQGKTIHVPASALSRWVGAPDCEKAELQNIYLLMKINGLKSAH